MTWLFIDSRERRNTMFGWLGDPQAHLWPSENLVADLARRIKNADLRSSDGICVVSGPGSFSSIRIGVLVANLLARLHGLPLYAVDATAVSDLSALTENLHHNRIMKAEYVAPEYDCEPNITLPAAV